MVVCVATAKMSEFMSQLSYAHEPVQVSVTVNPSANVTDRTKEHIQGYCVKCRAKAEIKNPRHIIMKNLRHAIQGICPGYGTKMFRLGRG
jgi:hypothetical protein